MTDPYTPNAPHEAPTIDQPDALADTNASQPAPLAPSDSLPSIPGYRVLHEIARGGMGRVLAAHDLTLDRDVAIKVLLPGANAARFVRESRITARLPHPGVPPVHALGTLDDGAPFMAMKLIAGHTLAAEIKTGDRARLLQVFTQLCQAVGFAHSRGIIHRDLKPNNVMVGAFGEVQVMDWGLAKDSSAHDLPDESRTLSTLTAAVVDGDSAETRSFNLAPLAESTDDHTRAGSVLGTPSYMAPEQARGEPADARTDVFALGGILCAILTGHPPFRGQSAREVIQRAAANDLADAFARLDASDADPDLLALCRRCLSPAPADRPPNAQAISDAMSAYLANVQDRLHTLDRERAVAAATSIQDRRRRKSLYIAAALLLLTLTAGVVGTTLAMFEAKHQEADAKKGHKRADDERERAEANFATARELAFNLGNQIHQLQAGEKDPRRADRARLQALNDARVQFDRFRESLPDDEAVQWQAAAMHRYAANSSRFLTDYQAAESAYSTSIQIMERLANRFPKKVKYSFTLSLTLADRAMLEMLMGRLNDAASTLDRASAIAERSPSQQLPVDRARTLGYIDHDRAKIAYVRGRFEESIGFATAALEWLNELNRLANIQDLRQAVDPLIAVWATNDLAIARRELGQFDAAIASHDDALERIKKLDGPGVSQDVTYWVCEVREQRGRTARLIPTQRSAAAIDLTELTRIAESLVEDYPQVPYYREKLAAIHVTRGELLTALGQPEAAVAELMKSLAVSRALLDRFGVLSSFMLVRGRAYLVLGQAQTAAGKPADAQTAWKNAAKVFELELKPDPDNFHHRRGLADAQRELKASAK